MKLRGFCLFGSSPNARPFKKRSAQLNKFAGFGCGHDPQYVGGFIFIFSSFKKNLK